MAIANLPHDVLFTIMKFASDTRVDWRICKRREAACIRSLEGGSALEYHDDKQLLDWTLYGRLFMTETLEQFPAFGVPGFLQLQAPPPMEDFRRWYLLQYRWLTYTGGQANLWTCSTD